MSAQGLYVLSIPGDYWKVGIAKDVFKRIRELQTGCPEKIVCTMFLDVTAEGIEAQRMERVLHDRLNVYRTSGEWFRAPRAIMSASVKEVWLELCSPKSSDGGVDGHAKAVVQPTDPMEHTKSAAGIKPGPSEAKPKRAPRGTLDRKTYQRDLMRKRRQEEARRKKEQEK